MVSNSVARFSGPGLSGWINPIGRGRNKLWQS